jgi:hypothetical protein
VHAKTKTVEAKEMPRAARYILNKKKRVVKNKWFMHKLREGNGSALPGGQDWKGPCAIWTMARKPQRGAKKWKLWMRRNIVDSNGAMADSPEGNADNFAACYNELFAKKVVDRTKADALCGEMRKIQTDRVWLPPTAKESRSAVQALKTTAPGTSGVPSAAWKTLIDTPELEMVSLEVMRKCWKDKRVPENWNSFYMIVLEKKGDLSRPKNYRGVSISETLAKSTRPS